MTASATQGGHKNCNVCIAVGQLVKITYFVSVSSVQTSVQNEMLKCCNEIQNHF